MEDPVTRLQLGERVVVRHRRPDPEVGPGEPPLTDAVGTLTHVDEHVLVLETRRGSVTVPRDRVVLVKAVPPPPSRPGRPHLAIGTDDLEAAMVGSWPAVEREALGQWTLRASSGFTHRGNSVSVVGDPGLPVEDAVAHVEAWYADRSLPPALSLPVGPGEGVGAHPLAGLLLARGYEQHSRSRVMTAATSDVAAAAAATSPHSPHSPHREDALEVRVAAAMDPRWLEAYARYRPLVPGATEAVLTGSPEQVFATALDPSAPEAEQVVGLARLGVASRWGGLAAVWVAPSHRRLGLAQRMSGALATWAAGHGIRSLHLQVEHGNEPATALYERLGFTVHHDYGYLGRRRVSRR